MILRGAKKKVIAAAVALGLVGASMGVLSGTAHAASGDMTIAQYSYIAVGPVTDIDPACTEAGTNTSGDWVGTTTPTNLTCQGTAGCIAVTINADTAFITKGAPTYAEMTLNYITIDLDGNGCSPDLDNCRIHLTGSRTLHSYNYVNTGGGNYVGTFTENAPNPDNNTRAGVYTLSNCSAAFTTLVNAQLGSNPILTTYFEVSVAA